MIKGKCFEKTHLDPKRNWIVEASKWPDESEPEAKNHLTNAFHSRSFRKVYKVQF